MPPVTLVHTLVSLFFDVEIELLKWPSRSADANPIENLLVLLAQKIYNGGHQFESLDDLKQALNNAWENIDLSVLQNRLLSTIERRGDVTSC